MALGKKSHLGCLLGKGEWTLQTAGAVTVVGRKAPAPGIRDRSFAPDFLPCMS